MSEKSVLARGWTSNVEFGCRHVPGFFHMVNSEWTYSKLSTSELPTCMLHCVCVELLSRGVIDVVIGMFIVCRFIYYDKTDFTAETALPLMYAASKCLLTQLVTQCVEVLADDVDVNTVCSYLMHSLCIEENDLKKTCLEFISKEAHCILCTKEFLNLSREGLEEIIAMDTLGITNERQLFESCMQWARFQLQKPGKERPTDDDIRSKLGNVLYKIRFPTMTPKCFAALTAHSNVLSAEEKHDVYVYMTTKEELESLKFMTESRRRIEEILNRFPSVSNVFWPCAVAVSFETTAGMYLTGVGLFGGKEACIHHMTLSVSKENDILFTSVTQLTSDGSTAPVKIRFDDPIHVHPYTRYTVAACLRGLQTWSGIGGKSQYVFDEFHKITFHPLTNCLNDDVSHGQIPQLLYYWDDLHVDMCDRIDDSKPIRHAKAM